MTWMTPLVAGMLAWMRVALPTITLPLAVLIGATFPFAVLTLVSRATSADLTVAAPTW